MPMDPETKRRVIILFLVGLIAVLVFSLLALYDYHFSYERSEGPISYDRENYFEFYIPTGDGSTLVAGEEVNLTVGMANFLGESKNLTLVWGTSLNGTVVVVESLAYVVEMDVDAVYYYDLSLEDKGTQEIRLILIVPEATTVYFDLRTEDGSVLGSKELLFK